MTSQKWQFIRLITEVLIKHESWCLKWIKKIEFGTGGFRGVIGDDFNKENIQLVAQAISNLVKEVKSNKPIVVGYDYRFLSEFASKWMCEVFAANGIESLLSNEPTPTPAVIIKQDI